MRNANSQVFTNQNDSSLISVNFVFPNESSESAETLKIHFKYFSMGMHSVFITTEGTVKLNSLDFFSFILNSYVLV